MKSNLILVLILGGSLFVRLYRTPDLLGFWYDQGRDAIVVRDIIKNIQPVLIGPTTGIEGIFLGPFYYYLLTPLYLFSQGSPVFPAMALATLNVAAIYLLFLLGREYFSTKVGLLAAFLYGFSNSMVYANRWLSNPTPLPFFALLSLWCLLRIIHSHATKVHWLVLGLTLGLGLQLEAASAIFFIPATATVLFIFRKNYNKLLFPLALVTFLFTLLPQLIFDLRHQNLLFKALTNFLFASKSATLPISTIVSNHLSTYFDSFAHKFFLHTHVAWLFTISFPVLAFMIRRRLPVKFFVCLVVWWMIPLIALLFYQGNHGYVWDYYFTGIYPIEVLLIALVWFIAFKFFVSARVLIVVLFSVFVFQNYLALKSFLLSPRPVYVTYASIIESVDWVYSDAGDQSFNVDIYVPPVISHAYDYLFFWRGQTKFHRLPSVDRVPLLYTLLEPDTARFREEWLARQSSYASIIGENSFGQVLVQKRQRYEHTY